MYVSDFPKLNYENLEESGTLGLYPEWKLACFVAAQEIFVDKMLRAGDSARLD